MSNQEIVENVRARLKSHKEHRIGAAKKKVLLMLAGGLALSLSGSPRTSWKILGALAKEWRELGRQSAERAINSLYASKLLEVREGAEGALTLVLSEDGKRRALTYNLIHMKIKVPAVWDRMWRIISFDVPEHEKIIRDSLRGHLFRLNFYELHKSVFIHPFECLDEVKYVAALHGAGDYIRYILAIHLDNEDELKKFFHLA